MGQVWDDFTLAGFNDTTGDYSIGEHVTKLNDWVDKHRLTTFPLCTNTPDGVPDGTMARPIAADGGWFLRKRGRIGGYGGAFQGSTICKLGEGEPLDDAT